MSDGGRPIGYTPSPVAAPGDRIEVKVDTSSPFRADLVELLHGDTDPAGPGALERRVDAFPEVSRAGSRQSLDPGSYAVGEVPEAGTADTLTLATWLYPTRPGGREQIVIGLGLDPGAPGSFRLTLDERGGLAARWTSADGATGSLGTGRGLAPRTWTLVVATVEREGAIDIASIPLGPSLEPVSTARSSGNHLAPFGGGLLLAGETDAAGRPAHCLDGKLDRPTVFAGRLEPGDVRERMIAPPAGTDVLLSLDGGIDPASCVWAARVGADARLVNMPTRAVTGFNWTGDELDWRRAPEEYGAVHFHFDDLEDAGWKTDFELDLPGDLTDGVYAVRLRAADGGEDRIPVIVRRLQPRAPVAVLLPTLTYLAYGAEPPAPEFETVTESPGDTYAAEAHLVSQYNHHSDGSGVVHASFRRPLPTMRPDYRYWLTGKPHGLGADLYLLHWLRERGQPFDLLVDGDLDAGGREVLSPYRVVITGSHPEYTTRREMRALKEWSEDGGRLMYLGGNGFTMVTGFHRERRYVSEIRRTFSHAGLWESAPGEAHLAYGGEPGGHWAHRRERPRELTGVETVGMGFHSGRPYRRCPDSYRPEAAFVFDGVRDDEEIGARALGFPAAAAYEIDSADYDLGTPPQALILARASDFDDDYVPLSADPRIRAEIVLVPTAARGAVFSVGSITWTAGLACAGGNGAVARITANVLDAFLADEWQSRPRDA